MDADPERELRVLIEKQQQIREFILGYLRGCDRGDSVELLITPVPLTHHGDFLVAAKDIPVLLVTLGKRSPKGGMDFVRNQLMDVEGDVARAESCLSRIKGLRLQRRASHPTRGRPIHRSLRPSRREMAYKPSAQSPASGIWLRCVGIGRWPGEVSLRHQGQERPRVLDTMQGFAARAAKMSDVFEVVAGSRL